MFFTVYVALFRYAISFVQGRITNEHVIRIYAAWIVASMQNLLACFKRSCKNFVHDAVSMCVATKPTNPPITIFVDCPEPNPATGIWFRLNFCVNAVGESGHAASPCGVGGAPMPGGGELFETRPGGGAADIGPPLADIAN